MRISDHISYKEATRSNTAIRHGIDNTPSDYEITNGILLAEKVFEPLRTWVGGPIKITSFFRCVELNKVLKGSKRSQHCQFRAIDLDDTHGFKTNAEKNTHDTSTWVLAASANCFAFLWSSSALAADRAAAGRLADRAGASANRISGEFSGITACGTEDEVVQEVAAAVLDLRRVIHTEIKASLATTQ